MKTIVDTTIWSLALRRKPAQLNHKEQAIVKELAELIWENRVLLIGIVRQEILSGIKDPLVFKRVRDKLRAYPDEPIVKEDYEYAAECYTLCRSAGIASSPIDMLLCALSIRLNAPIFTLDKDFHHYEKHLPCHLYVSRT
ncbi:MAG TPA: PIN domain-containing protein [Candidatus Hydrogenedentes bacterium]|nr:PIN domain-containing protein [Candidatus Hydrogenedentota bacterium]